MSTQFRIVVGSDGAGFQYKEAVKADFGRNPRVARVIDVGVDANGKTDYPAIAYEAAQMIARGEADRALLICGTGLGCGHYRQQGSRHPRRDRP